MYWPRCVLCLQAHVARGVCVPTSQHTRRHDATEDVPPLMQGKQQKLEHTPYQEGLLRYTLRVCRRAARTANEVKPTMPDIESLVKGWV